MFELYHPVHGAAEAEMRALLARAGLRLDALPAETLLLYDGDAPIGTASRDRDVLRYIAVDPAAAGAGACAAMVSALTASAAAEGVTHLFLCTKPENRRMFASLGFYALVESAQAVLLENRRNGLQDFLAGLPRGAGRIGAVVMNADPFTNGHLYLCEQAAARCDFLYVFILSEDASQYSAASRLAMAKAALADIPKAHVCPSGRYMVSMATFPLYFIKDAAEAAQEQAALDARLFAARIAPALGISARFVGSEPYCPLTARYNAALRAILPGCGVEFCEFPRKDGISAGAVRRALAAGETESVRALVPAATYAYLLRNPC